MLHARRLMLEHPATGERLDLAAPIPEDMADLLQFLRKYDQSAQGQVANGATRGHGDAGRRGDSDTGDTERG